MKYIILFILFPFIGYSQTINTISGTTVSTSTVTTQSTTNLPSTLSLTGSFGKVPVETSAATYVVLETDYLVYLNLAGAQTVTLPAASTRSGRFLIFRNPTTTVKTISTYTDITGTTSTVIPATDGLYLQSNGTIWQQLNRTFNDAGAKTLNGNLTLGNTAGNTVTIGNTTGAITVNSGTGAINIASDATANAVNIGTGGAVKTVVIGSTSGTSPTTVRSGTSGLTLSSTATTTNGIIYLPVNTTGAGIGVTNTTLTSGSLLNLASTSVVKTSAMRGVTVALSGALTTASQSIAAAEFSNTHTGTTQTNIGIIATATGGTLNYAGLFTGRVGINNNLPLNNLSVTGVQGFGTTSLTNFATNTTLTASTSVDLNVAININQSTAGITLTLPSPTVTGETRMLIVSNTGSVNFIINNVLIVPSGSQLFTWNNTSLQWASAGTNKPLPRFRATRNTTLSIPNTTITDVTWTGVDFNSGDFVTGTGVFTASVAGMYHFDANLRLDFNTTPAQEMFMEITSSNTQAARGGFSLSGVLGNATSFYYAGCSTNILLAVGETVKVRIKQDSGTAQNLNGSPSVVSFSGYLVPDRF